MSIFHKVGQFFYNMVCSRNGNVNSKIFIGIVSFIVAVILAFLQYPTQYPIMFLTFSGSCFGFSCFDNKSAFQFKNSETKTETITTNKDTEVKIDAAEITNKIVDKITKRGKKK